MLSALAVPLRLEGGSHFIRLQNIRTRLQKQRFQGAEGADLGGIIEPGPRMDPLKFQ
jgi:hypothetical protein